jgi:hypothetical protein
MKYLKQKLLDFGKKFDFISYLKRYDTRDDFGFVDPSLKYVAYRANK